MGLFSKILTGLGLKEKQAKPSPTESSPAPVEAQTPTTQPTSTQAAPDPENTFYPIDVSDSSTTELVDISATLENLAKSSGQPLNWRTSIVDLLKLLNLDYSLAARKELAQELGCPADKQADSAQMNIWLHKEVMKKIAENGGKVPDELR